MGFRSFPFSAVVRGFLRPIFLPRFRRRSTYRFRVFPVHPYDGESDYLIMITGASLMWVGVCLMGIGISLMAIGVSLMSIGVSLNSNGRRCKSNGHWCRSDEHWSRPVVFRKIRFVNWFHGLSVRFVVSFWFSKNRFRVWFGVLSSRDS